MYSTPAELKLLISEKELVQLASDSKQIADWHSREIQNVLTEAIDQADGEIDGYVGMVQTLPMPKTPRIISNLSAKIAVYNMLRRRPHMPDSWQSEYDRCLRLLEKIAEGKLSLESGEEGSENQDENEAGSGEAVVITAPKRFSSY